MNYIDYFTGNSSQGHNRSITKVSREIIALFFDEKYRQYDQVPFNNSLLLLTVSNQTGDKLLI